MTAELSNQSNCKMYKWLLYIFLFTSAKAIAQQPNFILTVLLQKMVYHIIKSTASLVINVDLCGWEQMMD
jgi:hypothetical protein